jgi:general secretion pathway protein H
MTTLSRHRRHTRGLTLLEVMIIIAVLVLMTGIGFSTFGALKGTQLRTQTNKIAAAVRHTFNRSVATGLYMRMVVDIDGDAYWVEASAVPQFLMVEKREEGDDDQGRDAKEREKEEEAARRAQDDDAPPPPQRERFQEDGVIQRVALEKGIGIDGVYTSGQEDVFRSGKAYIHFFPNGFVEPSMIYTTDGEEAFFTLVVSPLTGKVTRRVGKVDPDRDFGRPEDEEEEGR